MSTGPGGPGLREFTRDGGELGVASVHHRADRGAFPGRH